MNEKVKNIFEQLQNLTVFELAKLIKDLENVFGTTGLPLLNSVNNGTNVNPTIEIEESKKLFDLSLIEITATKKMDTINSNIWNHFLRKNYLEVLLV